MVQPAQQHLTVGIGATKGGFQNQGNPKLQGGVKLRQEPLHWGSSNVTVNQSLASTIPLIPLISLLGGLTL